MLHRGITVANAVVEVGRATMNTKTEGAGNQTDGRPPSSLRRLCVRE